jgi:hypothetical protein
VCAHGRNKVGEPPPTDFSLYSDETIPTHDQVACVKPFIYIPNTKHRKCRLGGERSLAYTYIYTCLFVYGRLLFNAHHLFGCFFLSPSSIFFSTPFFGGGGIIGRSVVYVYTMPVISLSLRSSASHSNSSSSSSSWSTEQHSSSSGGVGGTPRHLSLGGRLSALLLSFISPVAAVAAPLCPEKVRAGRQQKKGKYSMYIE